MDELMVLPEKVRGDLEYLLGRTYNQHGAITSNAACLGLLTEEYHEVIDAVRRNEDWRVRQELLDVANVCIRRVIELDLKNKREGGLS